ncbi:hypothetical protein AC739_12135 [Planococcus glaciei]|nr:hypothetical protein AC739_12135 [Planococcus glaciei]
MPAESVRLKRFQPESYIKIKNLFKQEEVKGLNNFLFPSRIEWLQELAPCPSLDRLPGFIGLVPPPALNKNGIQLV